MLMRVESGMGWELRLGDCLDPDRGLASLADKSIDHTLTDPPYSVHVENGQAVSGRRSGQAVVRKERIGVGFMSGGQRRDGRTRSMVGDMGVGDMGVLCREMVRTTKRWIAAFCAWEQLSDYVEMIDDAGGRYVRCCAWEKPDSTPQLSGDRPATWGECLAVGYGTKTGGLSWNGRGKRGLYKAGVCRGAQRSEHPTQKPLDLMLEILEDFTDVGDLVVDPFSGSGTTGVACIRLGRRFIGWEMNPDYFEIACRRLRGDEVRPRPEQPTLFGGAA